jgi:hypothetical protein
MKNGIRFIVLLATMWSTPAQNLGVSANCATNPPDFTKMSYKEADEASWKEDNLIGTGWKRICPEYVTNLVNELRTGQLDNDRKVLVIWLLGEFWLYGKLQAADTSTVEVFIEYIDLKATKFDPKGRARRWGDYPAQEALMYKVRAPAANPILQHLPTEGNELRRHLMCEVLRHVESWKGKLFDAAYGKATAQSQVEHELAEEPDSLKRANLKAALKELEK